MAHTTCFWGGYYLFSLFLYTQKMDYAHNSENLKLMCQQHDSKLLNSKYNPILLMQISFYILLQITEDNFASFSTLCSPRNIGLATPWLPVSLTHVAPVQAWIAKHLNHASKYRNGLKWLIQVLGKKMAHQEQRKKLSKNESKRKLSRPRRLSSTWRRKRRAKVTQDFQWNACNFSRPCNHLWPDHDWSCGQWVQTNFSHFTVASVIWAFREVYR